MSTTADTPSPALLPLNSPTGPRSPWLFSPAFDLLFVANIGWPLVLLFQLWGGLETNEGLRFWQIYFITTPHRWITLPLVFLDGERFQQRRRAFLLVAAIVIAVCLGVRITTGTLTCLLTVDYIWNAWHFAAQHHGIYRIYGRFSAPQPTTGILIEKILMRTFLVYVAVRVAGWSWSLETLDRLLANIDWAILAIPLWLLAAAVIKFRRSAFGQIVYLCSVLSLFTSMLFAVHFQRPALLLMLALASALFHAIEYLAVVSWAVTQKHNPAKGTQTLFSRFVPQWGLTLATFAIIIGLSGRMIELGWMQFWLLINLIAAFLHYAYDGMIWKARKQPTSA